MKPLIFEVPAVKGESIVVQEDILPAFYNYFHKHEQIQITAILSGKGVLTIKNKQIKFSSGQIFIIGSNQPHLLKSDEDVRSSDKVHAIHVYFKSEIILTNFNLIEFEEVKTFVKKIGSGLKLTIKETTPYLNYIKKICNTKGADRVFAFINFLRYSYFNLKCYSYFNTSEKTSETFFYTNNTRINEIYAYTLANFNTEISLKKIAKIANMTIPATCKYFKKCTRKTYMKFLKEMRIDYACSKIIKGNYNTIAEVAYASGFKNPIIFNRAFKSVTGTSPTAYKKLHQNTIEKAKHSFNPEKYFVFS